MLSTLFKSINSESGAVGIMAILAMVMLMSIGGALIVQSGTERDISTTYRDGIIAQNIAEAGIKHALLEIDRKKYPDEMSDDIEGTLGNGSYNVKISPKDNSNQRIFTSVASVNNVTRKIVVTFQETSAYDYAVCAGNTIMPQRSATVNGDIRANHNIYLNNELAVPDATIINGDVIAGQAVYYIDGIFGRARPGKLIEFTNAIEIPQAKYLTNGRNINNRGIKYTSGIFDSYDLGYNTKNTYYSPESLNILGNEIVLLLIPVRVQGEITGKGVVYVKGDANIYGEIDGELLLIATGNINIGTPLRYNKPVLDKESVWPGHFKDSSRVILIAGGDIFFNNCGDTMPGLGISQGAPMHGMAIAKGSINLYGNSMIIYDKQVREDFKEFLPKVTPILTPIKWVNN